jgi:hypothetical protein
MAFRPQVIGITGRKYNGKDTTANYICEKYGYKQLAFAGPLKDICGKLFGFNDEQLHGSLKETPDDSWFDLTPRQVLQFVGTDLFRNHMSELNERFGQDFWLLCAKNYMDRELLKNPDTVFVISDVRFPNEVDFVRKLNGIVFRVKRKSVNKKKKDTHQSELLIDELEVDYDLKNDSTKEDLYKVINDIFEQNEDFRKRFNKNKSNKINKIKNIFLNKI